MKCKFFRMNFYKKNKFRLIFMLSNIYTFSRGKRYFFIHKRSKQLKRRKRHKLFFLNS
jgi:hypothetical protein